MTDTTEFKAEVHCASCDGNLFEFPSDPQPDDMVICRGCAAKWRYADLQTAAKDKTFDAVKELFGNMLKDAGFK